MGVITVPFQISQFRVTVTVDTPDGPKSGDSIVRVVTHWGYFGRYMSSPRWVIFKHRVKGVAPIVDLGRWGTLVAALRGGGQRGEIMFRQMFTVLNGLAIDKPAYAGRNPFPELPDKASPTRFYPPLLWLPPRSNHPRDFKQLYPDQFRSVIGSGVRLQAIVVERAPHAPLTERIENAPDWLWTLRRYGAPKDSPHRLENPHRLQGRVQPYRTEFETATPPSFHDLEIKK